MLANLLNEDLDADLEETWENKRMANALTGVAVRLHATGCSLRETKAILALFDVERSHQSIFQWVRWLADSVSDPLSATPTRVAVDETAVKSNGE